MSVEQVPHIAGYTGDPIRGVAEGHVGRTLR